MHVSDCFIVHLLQLEVKSVFKKTGHKADRGQIVKSHIKFASLLCPLEGLVYAIGIISVDLKILIDRQFFYVKFLLVIFTN